MADDIDPDLLGRGDEGMGAFAGGGDPQRSSRIALGLAYGTFFLLVGGALAYTLIAGDIPEEELRAGRPSVLVTQDQIAVRVVGQEEGTQAQAGAAGGTGPASDGASAGTDRPDTPLGPDTFAGLLAPHPDPALIEQAEVGPLPVVGIDGRMPWRVYSRPHNTLETRPKVAVVVTNLGIHDARTEQALGLPGAVSLAFAPYSRKLDDWIAAARDGGHEVLLTLPMEPVDFPKSDPGPYALMSTFGSDQNTERLEWVLSRATGYIGLVAYQGSGFVANPETIRPVLTSIRDRGLLYLDGRQTAASSAPQIARMLGMPGGQTDIVIDATPSRAAIMTALKRAEALARANGSVIVLARPYPVSLDRLRIWLRELGDQGLALTPLSGIIADRIGIQG